jgi:hypothetical protein
VTPAIGWDLVGDVTWNRPPENWPPTIGWKLHNSSLNETKTYSGVVTVKFGAREVQYQFGGMVDTEGAPPEDTSDWDSTTNTVPIPAAAARYA